MQLTFMNKIKNQETKKGKGEEEQAEKWDVNKGQVGGWEGK